MGCTTYTVVFRQERLSEDRAKAFVQKLQLMLGPAIETRKGVRTSPQAVDSTIRPALERELERWNFGDRTHRIRNQLQETRAVMTENIEKMLDRSERLSEIEAKSSEMGKAALLFKQKSRSLQRQHLMNQVKFGVVAGSCATAATAVAVLPVVLAIAL